MPVVRPILLLAIVAMAPVRNCSFAAPPYADLAGTWQTDPNPSGRGMVFSIHMKGDSVLGRGYVLGPEGYVTDSMTVAGYATGSSVTFNGVQAKAGAASFDGRIASADKLSGSWIIADKPPAALVLRRE